MVWFVVGVGLLTLGMHFIVGLAQIHFSDTTSWVARLTPIAGGREQAALALIIVGLIFGFIKGRYVLVKTVRRVGERILSLPEPVKIQHVYSKGYLMLIGGMVLLGMSLKWLQIPPDLRGVVDVAIGSALMNGSLLYFRMALAVHKSKTHL